MGKGLVERGGKGRRNKAQKKASFLATRGELFPAEIHPFNPPPW
jgi:hypothetical protein